MPPGRPASGTTTRDLRIDWLRGLAMTCVIVNHSKISSIVSWFTYERFWIVTSAEVFVVLSGVVLGMVYGRKLAKYGWPVVVQGLMRRAFTLYLAFLAVTLSIVVLSLTGIDVRAIAKGSGLAAGWFLDPRAMDLGAWRDVMLMRSGPWPFEIVAMYVWLVAAAVPCLLLLRFVGWRGLLAASWTLYVLYHLAPHRLTAGDFERVFPILTWQLLFVHGITIGYHREELSALVTRHRRRVHRLLVAAAAASFAFMVLALCNPWAGGPAWLQLHVVSPERFTSVYGRLFGLSDLGAGRLVNLVVGLSLAYAILTYCWRVAEKLQPIFVTLGQQSLGAFVLHVYGILLLSQLPLANQLWLNTLIQIALIVAIAAALHTLQAWRPRTRKALEPQPQALAA